MDHSWRRAGESGHRALDAWEAALPPFAPASALEVPAERVEAVLAELADRLRASYPFYHPRYAGQMLKPPHPVAQLAYALAMRINANNHALDGGPATSALERECVTALTRLVGYPGDALGHLTGGGTVANLEALWVARERQPGRAIAYSRQAHYAHARACAILGVRAIAVDCDANGRMDLAALERQLAHDDVGTVVATIGTTGLGAIDPLPAMLALAERYGARVHADAAYGGYFALIAGNTPEAPVTAPPFAALRRCDSVVIDPHKHGLQPYGCGAVLFRDASDARVYLHDSPATYYTEGLHLGEISLECSRAGAAAAALWATLRCVPLERAVGLGPILTDTHQAALAWAARIAASKQLRLVVEPELDILAFFPVTCPLTASAISTATDRVFATLMNDPEEPVYLAKLSLEPPLVAARYPEVVWDQPRLLVLRSVLMKPEHLAAVDRLHAAVERATSAVLATAGAATRKPPIEHRKTGGVSA